MEGTPNNHESLTQVDHAWLFDVDGVITDPTEKKVSNPEILDEIENRLKSGHVVGFNTGRSIEFVVEQVLVPLEEKLGDKSLLEGVIAIGEKSGVQVTYEKGKRIEHIDESITVPQVIQNEVRTLVETEFSDQMFYDDTKKTMISVEMKNGGNIELFSEEQKILQQKMLDIISRHKTKADDDLKVDPTTIATDVESASVGKERGTLRFLQILKDRRQVPKMITAFGDSRSDLDMIEPLEATEVPFVFVFVGEAQQEPSSDKVHVTKAKYTEGTIEYLRTN